MNNPNKEEIDTSRNLAAQETKIIVFQEKQIRRIYHNEKWYYSIIDVVQVLTESLQLRPYWAKLKKKLVEEEGFDQTLPKWQRLKMKASD